MIAPFIPPGALNKVPNGNLLPFSGAFGTPPWGVNAASLASSLVPDPVFGLIHNAFMITPNTVNTAHYVGQGFNIRVAGGVSNVSLYVRPNTYTQAFLEVGDGIASAFGAYFDLMNGRVITPTQSGPNGQVISAAITPAGGGWFRISVVGVIAGASLLVGLAGPASGATTNFPGDGSSNIAIFGMQATDGPALYPYVQTGSTPAASMWAGSIGLPVFPYLPGQDIKLSKGPLWSTDVARSASGRDRALEYWDFPLWQFAVSYEVVRHRPTNDELAVMMEFFNSMKGQGGTFLFVDPTDCYASGVAFATGDGLTTTYQLTRAWNSIQEPVYAIYEPGAVVLDGASPITPSFPGTPSGGTVVYPSAPGGGDVLSWTGYFYYGCRFLQDDLTFDQMYDQLWSGQGLKFTSRRV